MFKTGIIGSVLALGVLVAAAQEKDKDKPKTIKDVMNIAHKGKEALLNKVLEGKGTDDDHKKLLDLYQILAGNKQPQGEEKSWKEKTDALVAAAKEVVEKKEGAIKKLTAAKDCKACHTIHRPKK